MDEIVNAMFPVLPKKKEMYLKIIKKGATPLV
jgi:hypothetical protein